MTTKEHARFIHTRSIIAILCTLALFIIAAISGRSQTPTPSPTPKLLPSMMPGVTTAPEMLIGMAYANLGEDKFGSAYAQFTAAIGMASKTTAPYIAKAYAGRGTAYVLFYREEIQRSDQESRRRQAVAIADFDKAIELGERTGAAYAGLALICMFRDDVKQAVIYTEKAVQLSPNNFGWVSGLGEVYLELQIYDRAIATLEHAVELVPTSSAAHFHLAQSYSLGSSKDFEKSRRSAEIALRLDPSNNAIRAFRAILAARMDDFETAEYHYRILNEKGAISAKTVRSFIDKQRSK